MLTHVHKVIHLVVGTFEQGLETSMVEYPPIECGQSDGATGALYRKIGFHRVHRTLVSTGRWRSMEAVKMLASVFDRTLGHFVTGRWRGTSGPADVAAYRGDSV